MRQRSSRGSTTENTVDYEQSAHKSPTRPACLPVMAMTQGVYAQATNDLGSCEPEAAGILLGPKDAESLATHWILDQSGHGTGASFTLGVKTLNRVLQDYRPCGLTGVGIWHSHPPGITTPSRGDLEYLEKLFFQPANEELTQFLFPIFCAGRVHPYIVWRRDERLVVTPATLLLV